MSPITQIALENYRCFAEKQTARLASLTLLVGENSTGKTSFLALIRVLLDAVDHGQHPNFKEEPFDLGSYDEIAHHRNIKGVPASTFQAVFTRANGFSGKITFGKDGTVPVPVQKHFSDGDTWIEDGVGPGPHYVIRVETDRGTWERQLPLDIIPGHSVPIDSLWRERILPLLLLPADMFSSEGQEVPNPFTPLRQSPAYSKEDFQSIITLVLPRRNGNSRPYASAPVRSKPQRTFNPAHTARDPEGNYAPMYLAVASSRDKEKWTALKNDLERFGRTAGLFDEISISRLGNSDSSPFQLQLRISEGNQESPLRNLIDVGYGISQVLPIITELLRPDASRMCLLQQPEVHLHPSAQAALGSLFCQVTGQGRQLVVETHSDYIIDRVRMEVRDGNSELKPDDVSILYFEQGNLGVRIHSIRLDELGNVIGAPDGYRSFFMQELDRSLKL